MTVKLLTKHHLKFLRLKGGYTSSSEPTLVKLPHCLKSHVTAQSSDSSNPREVDVKYITHKNDIY